MGKKYKEKDINTLSDEIQLIQMENFINDFENAMNKNLKNGIKKFAIMAGPVLLALFSYLIFHNPMMITIGVCISGVNSITTTITDFVKSLKRMHEYDPNISKLQEEKDVEEILEEGIGKSRDEDFYTEEYKSVIEPNETEEERKYRETLESQQKKTYEYNQHLKLVEDDTDFLDKDETMTQIIREVDAYCDAYNLPPLTITNSEWELLFDTSYSIFAKKEMENEFYDAMSELGRFTFAKALVNKQNEIGIKEFVDNLYYLQGHNINKKEVRALQQIIKSKLTTKKVIDFSDYKGNKRK